MKFGLLEREAVLARSDVARRVPERLALALALGVEREHLVAGIGQGAGGPPVHVLRALDRARGDHDAGVGTGLAVGPEAADELRTGAREERTRGRGLGVVGERVADRAARKLAEGGVDAPVGEVGHLPAEVGQERLRRCWEASA